jgi:DtxR family Mn-dependent transcriptional regulator
MDEITSGMKEYLKTGFLIEEGGNRAKHSELAKRLQVKPASVTEMIRKMGSTGLLDYKPYHEMKLMEKGEDTVRNILRRHRLLEKMFPDL